MTLFSIFLFAIAALFAVFAILIYKGKTNLFNGYRPEKVKDKAAYAKAFGNAVLVMAAAPAISGIIALFGETDAIALTVLAVLIVGFAIGFVLLARVQKKYTGGLF